MDEDFNLFNKEGKYKLKNIKYKTGAVTLYIMENVQNKEMHALKVIEYKDESELESYFKEAEIC